MFCTQDQIREFYNSDAGALWRGEIYRTVVGRWTCASLIPATITYEQADQFITEFKRKVDNNALGKGLRPWVVVDVTTELDASKAWVGIEYETGYSSAEEYSKIVNFVWNNAMYTAFDAEGCGTNPVEITFAPVVLDEFMTDEYHVDRLLTFAANNGIEQDRDFEPYEGCGDPDCDECSGDLTEPLIGMHCNISTPAYRALDQGDAYTVGRILDVSRRQGLSESDNELLFGRQPYGGFIPQTTDRGHRYIEGKLFDSTDDPEQWAKYKVVIGRIAALIEYLSQVYVPDMVVQEEYPHARVQIIYNIAEILHGKCGVEDMELGTFYCENYSYY